MTTIFKVVPRDEYTVGMMVRIGNGECGLVKAAIDSDEDYPLFACYRAYTASGKWLVGVDSEDYDITGEVVELKEAGQ